MPNIAGRVHTWPSLSELPQLYPDARNRANRGPQLYRAGRCFALDRPLDLDGRAAVLAVGSNGYPRQLHDKLVGSAADLQGIPLVPVMLRGLDTAWCPIRSRKGYLPVSLAERPGAVSLSWLQWLTHEQLNIISASEGPRYALVGGKPLASRTQTPANLPRPTRVYAWWFDSLLECDAEPVWLDIYGQQFTRRAAEIDHKFARGDSRSNPVPEGWQVVHRAADGGRISEQVMSRMC